MSELESGGFQPVIDDAQITDRAKIKRIVVCSGKVYYDLEAARDSATSATAPAAAAAADPVAIVRLEQFYPFPAKALVDIFASYPNVTEIVWTQEEPQNMGGWTFVAPRLQAITPANAKLRYIGRDASASPATGSYAIHNLEQANLVNDSLTIGTVSVART